MPITQEFIESLMKQNQMQLEQIEKLNQTIDELNATIKELREQLNKNSGNTKTPATAPNRRHLMALRKYPKVCAKKAVRSAADRKDIKEPILLFLPSLTKSIGICTPIVPHVLTGISALQRLALRKHVTSLTR